MPSLIMKTGKAKVRMAPPRPVMSEKKVAVVKKLKDELLSAQKCVEQAMEKKSYFERKHDSIPGYQNDTVIGSDLTQFLVPRSQDKYHMVRWAFALRSANRKVKYLTKVLKEKIKGYE